MREATSFLAVLGTRKTRQMWQYFFEEEEEEEEEEIDPVYKRTESGSEIAFCYFFKFFRLVL